MWISKKKYKQLEDRADFWQKEYANSNESKTAFLHSMSDRLKMSNMEIDRLNEQLEDYETVKAELHEFKQKYADEVQKRLELIKLLENTP